MNVVRSIDAMRRACRALKRGERELGLVPTMGALHEGHLSLVRRALSECDAVTVSIFVNPKQFGANEDYDVYPRAFEDDCAKLDAVGVELVFAPSPAGMYPEGASTFVEVPDIGARLDGVSRPGHFRGVATVVAKLLNITEANRAYFGQKDAAQVAVLQAMVRDLNFAAQLVICPTVRERDGLAMSSRNHFLSPEDRRPAQKLRAALSVAERAVSAGETDALALRGAMLEALASDPRIQVDYVEVVDPVTLRRLGDASEGALIAVAARVGSTRLIDNVMVEAVKHESLA
jgi:pantoate--beta-alanine ligase